MENLQENQEQVNQEQVNNEEVIEKVENEEIILPSDEIEPEALPEKYEGKTPQELYNLMKKEEEYKKSKQEENSKEKIEDESKKELEENSKEENKSEEKTLEDVVNDYITNGEISEENNKILEEKGLTKEQVEIYKYGLDKKAEDEANQLLESFGTSMDEYKIVNNWMLETKSETEILEFKEAVSKADNNTLKFILNGVYNEYKTSVNSNSNKTKIIHSSQSKPSPDFYSSREEYFKDMKDIRFKKDRKYSEKVEAKFLRTNRKNW